MRFFIDTANLEQVRIANALGVLDGVTTNPTLMAREGVRGIKAIENHYLDICDIVDGPVSAEVLSVTYDDIIEEGTHLSSLHPQIVVKIPCTADGIKAIRHFTDNGIETNCTLVFSIGQALMAAKAGATYVSPFVGRLDDISSDGIALVSEIVDVFSYYAYDSLVLAASLRSVQHVIECVRVGADVVTCQLPTIMALLDHPLTDRGLDIFQKDGKKML